MRKYLLILFLLLVIPLSLALQTNDNPSIGIDIAGPQLSDLSQGKSTVFEFFLFNKSTGQQQTGATCTFILYGGGSYNGNKILSNTSALGTASSISYSIPSSNLSEIGEYRSQLNCNSTNAAGFYNQEFNVQSPGDLNLFIVLAISATVVLGFAFLFQNEYIGFLAGAMYIVVGVYVMIYGLAGLSDMYTRTIAFISLGLGFIFEIAAGYKVATGGEPSFEDD